MSTASLTKVAFNTVEFDTNSCFSTATNRFTPTKAGYYHISMSILATMAGTAGFTLSGHLYKNGSAYKSTYQLINYNGTFSQSLKVETVVYLNGSTDYVEGYLGTNTGTVSNMAGASSTYISGYWARP